MGTDWTLGLGTLGLWDLGQDGRVIGVGAGAGAGAGLESGTAEGAGGREGTGEVQEELRQSKVKYFIGISL